MKFEYLSVAAILALVCHSRVCATLVDVVDQSYTSTTYNLGYGLGHGGYTVGQSFTAGITGNLRAVRVDVHRFDSDLNIGTTISLSVFAFEGDSPSLTPMGSTTLPNGESLFSNLVELLVPVPVVAGRQYLLGATLNGPHPEYSGMSWKGQFGDGSAYPRGQVYTYYPPEQPTSWRSHPTDDLFFQTVVRIPEPQSRWLLLTASGAVFFATRRRM